MHSFGTTVPRHRVKTRKLRSLVQDSSRTRMTCEADVLQYYRTFMCYSLSPVHSHHLTEEGQDSVFWHGLHPVDREILWPQLIAKTPLQPLDIPFFEFELLNITRRYPLPSYMSESDRRFSSSISTLPSESRYIPAPSATEDKPEPETILPITPTSPSMPSLESLCSNVVPNQSPSSFSRSLRLLQSLRAGGREFGKIAL